MTPGQDPADALIRELIAGGRAPTEAEIAAIVGRMASAPFNEQVVRVPKRYAEVRYRGRTLEPREPSLLLHLALRAAYDGQWAAETTEAEYLTDLRASVVAPDARLVVYRRQGGAIAATLGPNLVPARRRGDSPQALIYVVYSADRSRIVTGYQASGVATLSIPGDARWLT